MDLYDKINLIQNRQNQQANEANLEQLQANEAELKKLRQQLAREEGKPKCPYCGGGTEKGYDVCKNCASPIIWRGHFVGKPGDESKLQRRYDVSKQQQLVNQQKQKIKRKQRQESKRLEDEKEERRFWVKYILGVGGAIGFGIYGVWWLHDAKKRGEVRAREIRKQNGR